MKTFFVTAAKAIVAGTITVLAVERIPGYLPEVLVIKGVDTRPYLAAGVALGGLMFVASKFGGPVAIVKAA